MKRNEIAINFSVTHACFSTVFLKSAVLAAQNTKKKKKDCNPSSVLNK